MTVSVLLITYNHEKYIREAIEGVLIQKTNFDVRLIIGEDFSTDKTRKICEEYANRFPNKIHLLDSDRNHGIIPNFIRTIEAAEGEYIALCEGDDFWIDPLKLQKQIDFLREKKDYGIVYSDFQISDEKENTDEINRLKGIRDRFKSGNIFFDLLQGSFIPALTVCMRKEALDRLLPMMKNKSYIVDYWMWFHISLLYKIQFLPIKTALYRRHAEGATSSVNILQHLQKSGPIYYDALTYFHRVGMFSENVSSERAIIFRSCLTTFRSKKLDVSRSLHLLFLALYYFSFTGILSLWRRKLKWE